MDEFLDWVSSDFAEMSLRYRREAAFRIRMADRMGDFDDRFMNGESRRMYNDGLASMQMQKECAEDASELGKK